LVKGSEDSLRVLFAGTPAPALSTLSALIASHHEIVGVFSQPDRAQGRGQKVRSTPVADLARSSGLPLFQPEQINEEQALIASLSADVAVVVAYGALLKQSLLEIPQHGWINLHFSLLPAYRGAAPVHHALLHGEELTGATTFQLDAGMDTGPILGQITERTTPRDTTGELLARLSISGSGLMLATLDLIERGEAKPVAQPAEGVSYAPKIDRTMARIDWGQSALLIERQVRAMSPEPGAWTMLSEVAISIESAIPWTPSDSHPSPELAPGEVLATKSQVVVGTGRGLLQLQLVRPSGRASMRAEDWARGVRDAVVFQ
jgi:methionyl-tRNA formyltransferase